MSERINLQTMEQLATFLAKASKKRKGKKSKKSKKGKKGKPQVLDTSTRQAMLNKLGIKQNVIDAKEDTAYDKLKKRAEGGSLSLIYALQKDVKDIQSRFMGGSVQPQVRPKGVGRVTQQTGFQDKNASFDSAIQSQRQATENKKNQDRIEKEAKAELKRLEAESKAEVKRIEAESKAEQKRARKEQRELEDRIEEQEKQEAQTRKQLIVRERIDKARDDKERARREKEAIEEAPPFKGKKTIQRPITSYTIAQGMRTFTDFAPNPPDIGNSSGLPPLPFNRQRDQYDPLEPTPFYRSTADRIEAPVLQEVLDAMIAGNQEFPPPQEEFPPPQEEFPPPQDESMTDEALLGLSSGMTEEVSNSALGGGGSVAQETSVASPSPKKKGGRGRPAGSKNKPKPVPSEPSQVAMIGSSSVTGKTIKGKTPANTPSASQE